VELIMRPLTQILRFSRDKRGIAATEFALIAPALIVMVMGVLEMSMRFRAVEEASRYVHQVADLISREDTLTTAALNEIYDASTEMMKPLDTTDNLDLDVSSVIFRTNAATPSIAWRRVAGEAISFNAEEAAGMGAENETVLRVGIRYRYESVLSSMFGGGTVNIEREAFARPREERIIRIDGAAEDNGGEARTFGS
jgi:Flp pilus assembly protein TadG